ALNRAAQLLLEVAGGSLCKGFVSQKGQVPSSPMVHYRPSRAKVILGIDIPADRQLLILKNLGCAIDQKRETGSCSITPPSARLDLTREIDLIEEVARVAGYG